MANSGQRSKPAEAYWNILQAIAWIIGHDEELIARASDRAENPLRGAAFDARLAYRYRDVDGNKAEEELWLASAAAEVHPLGRANGRGSLTPMPDHEWHGLEFSHPIGAAPLAAPTAQSGGATRWHDIVFPAKEIMARWPEPLSASEADKLVGASSKSPTALPSKMKSPAKRRGRPKGSGNIASDDPILDDMVAELAASPGRSRDSIIVKHADRAEGKVLASKVRRLRRKLSERIQNTAS